MFFFFFSPVYCWYTAGIHITILSKNDPDLIVDFVKVYICLNHFLLIIWFYISNSGCDREEIYLLKLTACFFQFSSFFVHIFIVFPYLVAFKVSSVELIDTFSHEYTIFHYYFFFIEGIVFSVEEFNKQIVSVCFKITKLLLSFACYCYLPRFWM